MRTRSHTLGQGHGEFYVQEIYYVLGHTFVRDVMGHTFSSYAGRLVGLPRPTRPSLVGPSGPTRSCVYTTYDDGRQRHGTKAKKKQKRVSQQQWRTQGPSALASPPWKGHGKGKGKCKKGKHTKW